jgi:ATP-dependent helicase/nuclease subunit A
VKRDMEISRDEVRVMTVHGAKGLEAPVVFLVDTTTSPADTTRLKLVRMPLGNAGPHAPCVVVWAGKKAEDPPVVAEARAAMLAETEDEYRRLLYVAMTRAADRLIVGGCMPGNRNSLRPLSWYDLIEKGLATSGLQMQNVPPPDGVVKRHLRAEDASPERGVAAASAHPAPLQLPGWLRTLAPREALSEDVLRPSDPAFEEGRAIRAGESAPQRERALQRGLLVHRLLQSLPDLAVERRGEAAALYLARNAEDWNEEERVALAAKVFALLEDARFAAVFGAGSRAEVSIAGRLERPGRAPALVSGQIDRLVVTPDEILIVDFKTNHAPPRSIADSPPAYLRQLALYRAVLAKLYPQKRVRAALLWTETAELLEIPPPALDAQLASAADGARPA